PVGRLTFADEQAPATRHLLASHAAYGTWNVTNGGPATSWADLARSVFELSGRDPGDVTDVTTEEYAAGRTQAPRPRHSALSLERLRESGFEPEDATSALARYVRE
ncbi:MAG: sugar nucleotide-binding protein, partial [Kineosporiaceae bacterium]